MYLIDSNVFIQAKNLHYDFDVFPGFWEWLQRNESCLLGSIEEVYKELIKSNDELSSWVRNCKPNFFAEPNAETIDKFKKVNEYVISKYETAISSKFLKGADPWLIAQACAHNCIVVTNETLVPAISKQAKIPNICAQFNVTCITPFQMLKDLKARFILEPAASGN